MKKKTLPLDVSALLVYLVIVVVFVDIVFVVVVIIIVVVVVIVFDAIAIVVCNADIQHLQSNPSSSSAASQCQSGPSCLFADAASRPILQFFLFVSVCFLAFVSFAESDASIHPRSSVVFFSLLIPLVLDKELECSVTQHLVRVPNLYNTVEEPDYPTPCELG